MVRLAGVLALVLVALAPAQAGEVSKSNGYRSYVGGLNARLARYVHPTGKCSGASEQMATMYGNGDGHVGKPVSCGGRLDTSRPTVAHRTLQCGTKLSLTNPRNGRSVVATVTDRGPYTIATLDLGPATYRALGLNTSAYICVSKL